MPQLSSYLILSHSVYHYSRYTYFVATRIGHFIMQMYIKMHFHGWKNDKCISQRTVLTHCKYFVVYDCSVVVALGYNLEGSNPNIMVGSLSKAFNQSQMLCSKVALDVNVSQLR